MGALDELLRDAGALPGPAIGKWKAAGGKVVGYLCSYVPQELLLAAGVLPVRLRAPGCANTGHADIHLSHLNCTMVRACLETLRSGGFEFLDGLVCTNGCDHMRRLYDVLGVTGELPFLHLLTVPHKRGGEAVLDWHTDELSRFRTALEEAFGEPITDEGLQEAIGVSNKTRSLLGLVYKTRQQDVPPIAGAETLQVLLAGFAMPPEPYNRLLHGLLDELGQRQRTPSHRIRLVLAGSGGCDDPAYLDVIEEAGGLIVGDTLCSGSRSFRKPVASGGSDPLRDLARAYLERPACANLTDRTAERSELVVQTARACRADGVVYQRMRYCDLWGGQLLHLRPTLEEAGIPMLSLEREYVLGGRGQLITRIEAFIERLEG